MSKHDDNYRDLLRTMQCSFCETQGEGLVSWHHLKCIGAIRDWSWSAIPSCDPCHNPTSKKPSCHNAGISVAEQKIELNSTWMEIMTCYLDEVVSSALIERMHEVEKDSSMGENDKWRAMGEIYWQALIENGVI